MWWDPSEVVYTYLSFGWGSLYGKVPVWTGESWVKARARVGWGGGVHT